MTDQRTLKKIITEQRELIVKLKIAFSEQRQQIDDCETFLDMLWKDMELSKLFRTDLAKIRCRICNISDCSTREDREECLRIFESDYQQPIKEDKE